MAEDKSREDIPDELERECSSSRCSEKSLSLKDDSIERVCSLSHNSEVSTPLKDGSVDISTGRKASVKYEVLRQSNNTSKNKFPFERGTIKPEEYVAPEEYYKTQSCQTLGEEKDRVSVFVQFDMSVPQEWVEEMKLAMDDINVAAPGLNLQEIKESEARDKNKRPLIRVRAGCSPDEKESCTTYWNIRTILENPHRDWVIIVIGDSYEGNIKRTSRHEFMHALGFEHEHQRCDGKFFLNYPNTKKGVKETDLEIDTMDEEAKIYYEQQFLPKDNYFPVTPFDPFSVMLYEEEEGIGYCRETNANIWNARSNDTSLNTELSELDKVGLNLFYAPCRSSSQSYEPTLKENGMYYCGRQVMSRHNWPKDSIAEDNRCIEGGPNCPACRTLSKPKVNGMEIDAQWQGWSGLVYCGEKYALNDESESAERQCGEHYGKSCPDCAKIVQSPLMQHNDAIIDNKTIV